MASPFATTLVWIDAAKEQPRGDDLNVICWVGETEWHAGWWDEGDKQWRDCIDGTPLHGVTRWAVPDITATQRRIPEGWELESSVGKVNGARWMTIRNTKTQCGQDVYQSDDPLMYGFLAALYEAPIKEAGNA